MAEVAYRIVEIKKGNFYSLFHGNQGSRKFTFNEWMDADQKIVNDGSHGKEYLSGFHVLPSFEDTLKFFHRQFRNKAGRGIVKCLVEDTYPKSHSHSPVLLARRMKIVELVWEYNQEEENK